MGAADSCLVKRVDISSVWRQQLEEVNERVRAVAAQSLAKVKSDPSVSLDSKAVLEWGTSQITSLPIITDKLLEALWTKYAKPGSMWLSKEKATELVGTFLTYASTEGAKIARKAVLQRNGVSEPPRTVPQADAPPPPPLDPKVQAQVTAAEDEVYGLFAKWLVHENPVANLLFEELTRPDRDPEGGRPFRVHKSRYMSDFVPACNKICDFRPLKDILLRIHCTETA